MNKDQKTYGWKVPVNYMNKDRKTYGWRVPLYPTVDAQEAGAFIEHLSDENGGNVTPMQILDASRDEGSVLHACFEWDDSEAAERYRLKQAQKIIQNLVIIPVDREVIKRDVNVIIIDPETKDLEASTENDGGRIPVHVRAYLNATVDGKKTYMQTEKVMSDEELRTNALESVKAEIRNFINKYRGLAGIADILEQLAAELRGAEDGRDAGKGLEEAQEG